MPAFSRLARPFDDAPSGLRPKLAVIFAGLALAHALGWGLAWRAFQGHPVLMGAALLAYMLGLRHAFDADHIAAIDNTVRKLRHEGRAPISAGLFFALGHSSVVLCASAAVALWAWHDGGSAWRQWGGVVGTVVSGVFLLGIGAANLLVARGLWHALARARRGEPVGEEEVAQMLAGRGLLARLLRRCFALVARSWHLYPVGLLFGLGFDTASEIALIGLSAQQAAHGAGAGAVMLFPLLFTLGMTLMDTADSALMTGAYGWACACPVRKLGYNFAVTAVSVAVALGVGGFEVLGLMADRAGWRGAMAALFTRIDASMGLVGGGAVLLLGGMWMAALVFGARPARRLEA